MYRDMKMVVDTDNEIVSFSGVLEDVEALYYVVYDILDKYRNYKVVFVGDPKHFLNNESDNRH